MARSSAKKSAKPAAKKTVAKKKPAPKLVKKAKPVKKSTPAKKSAAKKPAPKLVKKKPAPKPAAKKPAAKAAAKPIAKKAAPAKAAASAKKLLKPVALAKPVLVKKPKRDYKPAKLPNGYKPTEKEEYMNPVQQEYFRQKLLNWRKELMIESRETLDHLHEENWHQADIADRASLETEAGVELRTRNRYLKLISKIDAAIRRIEDGEYGYCEESGEPIGLKRLEARPVATLSIEAQERHEKMERQYTDED
jgi:DnaK suppressor protein